MSNSSPDLSRRDFFKVSAAAIATVGVANFLKPSYATEVNVKTVALSNLPKAPVEVAKSSELVQKAWDYLLGEINSLHDLALEKRFLVSIRIQFLHLWNSIRVRLMYQRYIRCCYRSI